VTPLILAIFALLALAPLALSLRRVAAGRTRQESVLELHRAQLVELDRDLAEGRIGTAEHAEADLEVKRRLLAIADDPEPALPSAWGSRGLVVVALVVVPIAGAGLYLIDGHPELPAVPRAERLAQDARASQDAERMIIMLRQRLATMDQTSDLARQGYVLLGNVEHARGRLAEAAAAWQTAVGIRFDPTLAALAAEAETQVDGKVSPAAAELFRRALADGPPDAPWRKLVEQRLAEAGHQLR